jgi:S-formylglutathione hydrolase FrmB
VYSDTRVGLEEQRRSYGRRRAAFLAACGLVWAVAAAPAYGGLEVVAKQRLSERLLELTFATPAVDGTTGIRMLLPDGYHDSRRRYPVLYLLHGCCNGEIGFRTWTDRLEAERITAGRPLIVVMPDSGPDGGYVDWWNFGAGGPPQWERYHLEQLIPWVDRRYRTRAGRAGRAVAGLSMGGFGALSYAARHPDTFVSAAAFSGAVDMNVIRPGLAAIGRDDDRPLGSFQTEQIRTRAVNPWDLAGNLRGLDVALRSGDGRDASGKLIDVIEAGVHAANVSLHERLDDLGVAHVWDDYGAGTHSDRFWIRDLELTVPEVMRTLRDPPRRPKRVSFKAAEHRYEAYGWKVKVERRAMEFSELAGARRAGFALVGSGDAVVTTPRFYRPGAAFEVDVTGESSGEASVRRASRRGRLRIPVELGPANDLQQFSPEERKSPNRSFRARVKINRTAGGDR